MGIHTIEAPQLPTPVGGYRLKFLHCGLAGWRRASVALRFEK
jgi:hypothetical protein